MTKKIRANLGDKFVDDDGNAGIVGILWDDGDFTIESVIMHANPRLKKTEKNNYYHASGTRKQPLRPLSTKDL